MKLEIDLTDREEIAAALPLLQVILDNTPKTCGGQCGHAPANVAEVLARTQVAEGETVYSSQQIGVTSTPVFAAASEIAKTFDAAVTGPTIAQLQAAGALTSDPAAIFAGGAPAAPLAPSILPAPALGTTVPPPPANIAPITTTPGPASSVAAVASVELDARGLPWDSRIHSSSKAKLANGQWKNARGKAPEQVAQVEAELARISQPSTVAAVPLAPAITAAAPVGITPSAPSAPNADPTTFEQLMPRATAGVTSGAMPITAVGAACATQGLGSIVALQQNPQFVPLVWAALKQQFPGLA